MFLQCINIRFGVAREVNAFAGNVANGHFVVNIELLGDDILAVEFVADDAGADGVSVQADEQVKECGAVADFDVSRAIEVDGGEGFFGKVERVKVTLFVSEVRIGLKVFEGDFVFFRKRVLGRHKHVQRCRKERFEHEVVLLDELANDFFVFVAEVEHADFAFHFGDIVNDFVCLRFAEGEVVARAAEFTDDIDKRVHGKGIMLAAHGKNGVAALAASVAVFEECRLLYNLSCVREEFIAFVRDSDAFVGAVEYGDVQFAFEFVDRGGKARLRDKHSFGGFGDVSRVCNGDGVFKLL